MSTRTPQQPRARHRLGVALVAAGLAALLVPATGAQAVSPRAAAATDPGAYRATRTLTRTMDVGGTTKVVDTRTVTVSVDQTRELRGRQRIHVRWSGAHPSGGRAVNPFGESGMAQEYPVVLLQCRGLDDPALPAAKQISPETCWTATRQQRTQSATEDQAVWRHDAYATEADRGAKSGVDPYPAADCQDVDFLSTHITPFVAASGKRYLSCTSDTMPPEAAVGAAYPPSEQAAFSDSDGNGTAAFEVRSDVENESLGCNTATPCSLVVVPIMGISCIDADPLCTKYGRFAPGSSNFAGDGVDAAVSPLYWWSASNWRNRFAVPLRFGLPPDACTVLDSRAPTAFYGSELMSQAALQWAPAYCLRKDRFKFQHNRMSDPAAFTLMENGGAPAAFVSSRHPVEGTDPVAYAPTAVTGLAISYVIDRPDNAGPYTRLRLNARLIAKLLTQSYPASALGAQHPGMGKNPLSLNVDPEFVRLNPGIDTRSREAAATLLSLSQSSDVITTLTSYLAHDKDAAAFVAGRPDPWGMTVNPSYRGIHLPRAEWPMLDTFKPSSEQECLKQNPAVYLSQVAAPVSYLRTIAEAVLDAWPNVQTRCDRPTPTDPFKLGRVDRQGMGTRFMLGLTSLGDAARFGLDTAALETTPGHFVGPTTSSLGAALRHARPTGALQPFRLDADALAGDAGAYPGTMVVYTAARTHGLDRAEATKVAQFVRIATTEGQRPGVGNGELPRGFLPLVRSGATGPLARAAQKAGDAVAAQRGASPGSTPTRSPLPPGGPAPAGAGTATSPASSVPAPAPSASGKGAPVVSADAAPVAAVPTVATTSAVAGALLPTVIFLLLTGLVASAFSATALRRHQGPGQRP